MNEPGAAVNWVRDQFPISRNYLYMNHAAVAPMPQLAVERIRAVAEAVAESGDFHWPERNHEVERIRGLAARLLGAARDQELAFVGNTADGLSVIANGLDWRSGDNVVGALCEFPSNVYPWMRLAEHGVEYRQVPEREGRIDLDELLSRVDERTRVLALSWVQYASGFRSDLARIGAYCRERRVLFVVDAIQGLGGLEINVERQQVDACASACHKWLLGPEGLGLLYVSDRVLEQVRPTFVGWRSVRDRFGDWTRFDLSWGDGASRYECGTLNMMGIHALGASLELLMKVGVSRIEERVLELSEGLATGLCQRGFRLVSSRQQGEASGIVAVTHPRRDAAELVKGLRQQNILVAHRAGRLRLSPHFYNTWDEVERLLAAAEKL